MPLYEYKCQSCGNVFETRQNFSDDPLKIHEGCGGDVERLISAPALQFKGSGWYITDYARGGAGKKADDGSSKAEAKPDASKPAAKPEKSAPATTSPEKK